MSIHATVWTREGNYNITLDQWFNVKDHLHREDGPAVIYRHGLPFNDSGANCDMDWCVNGKLHREDGPAVIRHQHVSQNGKGYIRKVQEWWMNGIKLPADQVEDWLKKTQIDLSTTHGQDTFEFIWKTGKRMRQVHVWANNKKTTINTWTIDANFAEDLIKKAHREDGPAIIWPYHSMLWCRHGQLHREDGPAVVYNAGGEEWLVNGILHRLDGPAIKYANGSESWYKNGKLHRTSGPASILHINDEIIRTWFIDGKKLPTEQVQLWLMRKELNLNSELGQKIFYDKWSDHK